MGTSEWSNPGQARRTSAGDDAVQLGHAVGPLGKPQAHDGHVEHERVAVGEVLAAQVQDFCHRHVGSQPGFEEVLDLGDLEAVDSAGTGVWVVNTVDARPAAQASSQLNGAVHPFTLDPLDAQNRRGPRWCGTPPARGR